MKTQFPYFLFIGGRISKSLKTAVLTFIIFILLFGFTIINLIAQPTIEWDKTIGSMDSDRFYSLHQTTDGGYILGGYSNSNINGDKTENNKGNGDYWIVKLNAAGLKEWDKTIGGNSTDQLHYVHQTADGGYILGGTSDSEASGDKSKSNSGGLDFWIVKINAAGDKEWDKTLGGLENDFFYSMEQTADKGYIVGGFSWSGVGGDKSEGNRGVVDYWVIKLNGAGIIEWDKTIGGNNSDQLNVVHQTADGGFILGGTSDSEASGDKSQNNKGGSDFWIVKLNSSGNKEWDRTIGGNSEDIFPYLQQTTDNGYIMGGTSNSNISGDKSENSRGSQDYWVVKLSESGIKEWDKTFGGNESDNFGAIQQTADGGYFLGGFSRSGINGDKTGPFKGGADYWVIKLNAAGIKEWDKTVGGPAFETLAALQQTSDGGYILGGTSISNAGEDKTEDSKGSDDFWVIKLRGINSPPPLGFCNLALTTKVIQAEARYGLNGPFIGAGAIDLTVTGGTAPYTYRWNAGVSSQDLSLASPGYYNVTVTDATGCIAQTSVYVGRKNSPMTLSTSHINSSRPNGQEGSINLSVIGGVGPYMYSWSNGATTEDLTGLAAGQYTVTVTDNAGETATTSVTISEPGLALTLVAAHQNVSTGRAEDGFIDLTVNGGVGPYTYRWNAGPSTQDLTRVTAGQYIVTVTDANGTRASLTVWVGTGSMAAISATKMPGNTGESMMKEIGLEIFPNPVKDQALINFSLPATGKYTINLHDIRGAKVKTLATGQAATGKAQTIKIDLNGYAEGMYLLKLQTDKEIFTNRIVVKK